MTSRGQERSHLPQPVQVFVSIMAGMDGLRKRAPSPERLAPMGAFPLAAGSVRKRNVDRGAGWRSAIPSVQICWLLRIRVVGAAEFELEPAVGFGGNDHLSEEAFVILLREVLAEMAVPEPA